MAIIGGQFRDTADGRILKFLATQLDEAVAGKRYDKAIEICDTAQEMTSKDLQWEAVRNVLEIIRH